MDTRFNPSATGAAVTVDETFLREFRSYIGDEGEDYGQAPSRPDYV